MFTENFQDSLRSVLTYLLYGVTSDLFRLFGCTLGWISAFADLIIVTAFVSFSLHFVTF